MHYFSIWYWIKNCGEDFLMTFVPRICLYMIVTEFVGFSIFLFIIFHQERLRAQILELEVSASQKRLMKSDIEKNISQKRITLRQCLDRYISK